MKVGVKVNAFNYEMRLRRKELNMTQAELADLVGVRPVVISQIETLKKPGSPNLGIYDLLRRISIELEAEFYILFPKDYLDALANDVLGRGHSWDDFLYVIEVNVANGLAYDNRLQLPETIESKVDEENLMILFDEMLETVSARAAMLVKYYFGFVDGEEHDFSDCGKKFNITRARAQQIFHWTLKRLRAHPKMYEFAARANKDMFRGIKIDDDFRQYKKLYMDNLE